MTQEEVAAWVSAGAAVAQAVGAIAAIWASFRIATRAEQRSADAVRQAAERERAAEAASVARAEAAERRAEERERQIQSERTQARRARLVAFIRSVVEPAIEQAEVQIAAQTSNLHTVSGDLINAEQIRVAVDIEKVRLQEPELLPKLLAIKNHASDMQRRRTSPATEWVNESRQLVQALRDAMATLEAAI
jgi:hypothetical protein